MKEGDSGCFVLLESSTNEAFGASSGQGPAPIVGLGFGVNVNTTTAYMMPFDLVVEDIKKMTGKTVVQPRADGEAQPRS